MPIPVGTMEDLLVNSKMAVSNLISIVEEANNNQEKEKGEAQQFTKERDKAMDELADWIYELSVAAKCFFYAPLALS